MSKAQEIFSQARQRALCGWSDDFIANINSEQRPTARLGYQIGILERIGRIVEKNRHDDAVLARRMSWQ